MEQAQETSGEDHILVSPIWVFWVRIFQFVVSLIIVGLAAALIHDATLDEEALALAIGVITWIVVLYSVGTERYFLQQLYHVVAILVIDAVMLVLWLATFAAVAAKRAKFKYHVTVGGCIDNGGLFNSKVCFRSMSVLVRREDNVILFKRGQDELAAIAGLGAIVWLLFIATFAWTLKAFLDARKQGRFQFDSGSGQANTQSFQMEPKVEQQQLQIQQQQQQIQQLQIQQQQQQIQQLQQQAQQQQQIGIAQQPLGAYSPQVQPPYPASYPPPEQQAYAGGQYSVPSSPPQQQPSPSQYQAPYQAPLPPPITSSPPPPGIPPAVPLQPYQG